MESRELKNDKIVEMMEQLEKQKWVEINRISGKVQ